MKLVREQAILSWGKPRCFDIPTSLINIFSKFAWQIGAVLSEREPKSSCLDEHRRELLLHSILERAQKLLHYHNGIEVEEAPNIYANIHPISIESTSITLFSMRQVILQSTVKKSRAMYNQLA